MAGSPRRSRWVASDGRIPRRRKRRKPRRLPRLLAAGLIGLVSVSVGTVLALRWIDPPTSSVMVQHWLVGLLEGRPSPILHHEWVPWRQISPSLPLAVIAGEDQRFPEHSGFDFVEIRRAWATYQDGGRLRGASTLTQQVAKNLFLWHGQSWLRKGLEVPLTLLLELLWPKERILEVYLNIAQLGPDLYGVGAASWRYFSRPAETLTAREAALLAAVLPNPEGYSVTEPSARVRRRAAWIGEQMKRLGGTSYLEKL